MVRPSASLASPATSTSTPPSAGTTTGLVNLQPNETTSAPGNHSATARAASAIVYIPWAITPGSPTLVATASSWWIGLWSPLASAYATRSARVIVKVLVVHHASARWTSVALVEQTSVPSASVTSLVVPMMSLPPIWRSVATVSVAVSTSPGTTGRS